MSVKRKKLLASIYIIISFSIIYWIIPTMIARIKINNVSDISDTSYNKFIVQSNKVYSLTSFVALSENIQNSNMYNVKLDSNSNVVYKDSVNCSVVIDKKMDLNKVNLVINGENRKLNSYNQDINIELSEGENDLSIIFYNSNEKIKELDYKIFYVKPYQNQFNDKENKNGIAVHFNLNDDSTKLINELKAMGINLVRIDVDVDKIYKNGKYDFYEYDNLINKLNENGIGVVGIINNVEKFLSNKKTISNEDDIDFIINISCNFANRYNNIKYIQLLNEENLKYFSSDEIMWYCKCLSILHEKFKNKNMKIKITMGPTCPIAADEEDRLSSQTFIENIIKNIKNTEYVTSNQYDETSKGMWLKEIISKHNETINNIGGFTKFYISEYGISTYKNNLKMFSEEEKAGRFIKQNCIFDNNYIDLKILYQAKDNVNDIWNREQNFGLISYNYEPKKSYYSMKNYYQNTNGSEYIGQVNITDGLEAHIYDKDGKAKVIVWATDENKPVTIDYKDFDASDLYGNAIKNTNGKLEITSSPVYLDNISANYFYQAISNSITDGYSEFKNKFKDEISKVNGLNEKIDNLSNEAKNIYSLSEVDENTANNLMKGHFDLGNDLINAYNNGSLKVEYIKLSSMLDSLNTIGNSYEDLVTVSAKTRMNDLSEITNEVNRAKSLAEDNAQFDLVYPNKIYKFSQDLLDTSSYILGLDEENEIKTGLINSKALNAKYLANWSQEFSKIYIKDALKTSTNSIIEKNEIIKNNNKVVYENPDIKNSYEKLQNSINTLIENPETNNVDVVYLNQINIAKTIMTEAIAKTINIQRGDYKKIICNILNISDDYRTLYNYYIKSDEIDRTQIKNNINKIINRYNDNLDISILSIETEMIKQVKALYDNSIETDKISDNYLNKQRILQTCDIISQMLENDIKQYADKEFTQIMKSSNHDLNKYTNQDEIITINLPNDKAKIADNNGENSITFSKNDSKTIKINIRGYEYNYKIEVTNIDKSYPTLNISKEGTAITPKATDNNLDKITISKDGEEIKYNIDSTITEPGIYNITAIDKAGNKVNTKSIVYGTFINEQNVEEKYIPVLPGQKTQSIIENSEYSIANDKQQKSGNDLVATGDKLKLQNDTYIVITKGDITGSGKADIMSLIQLRKNIVGLKNFTKIQQLASDINSDGRTNSIDLVGERKLIVGVE